MYFLLKYVQEWSVHSIHQLEAYNIKRELYYFRGVIIVTSILVNKLVFLLGGSAAKLEYDDATCLCNPNYLIG